MSVTIFGTIADKDGITYWPKSQWVETRSGWRLQSTCDLGPGSSYARTHAAPLPVLVDHAGDPVGRVCHLERSGGALSAVAVIDDEDDARALTAVAEDSPMWWSSGTTVGPSGQLRMHELSLTRSPASVGLPSVRLWTGDVSSYLWISNRSARETPDILRRAHENRTEHRSAGGTLTIVELDEYGKQIDQRSSDLERWDRMEHSHSGHYAHAVLAVR